MQVPTLPRADKPPWVKCWEKAREVGDTRPFVEQIPAMAEALEDNVLNPPIPVAAFTDRKSWVQPKQYGYKMCRYDFAAPIESNHVCAIHPHRSNRQPLRRVSIGGMLFMLCLDCETSYGRRET